MEGPQPLLSWGEVEQVGRGPWGATAGTCLEEREAGGPGGLQREHRARGSEKWSGVRQTQITQEGLALRNSVPAPNGLSQLSTIGHMTTTRFPAQTELLEDRESDSPQCFPYAVRGKYSTGCVGWPNEGATHSWGAAAGVVGDERPAGAPDPQVPGAVVTGSAVMPGGHPYGT